jgi:polysaccharide export outer membrane protein
MTIPKPHSGADLNKRPYLSLSDRAEVLGEAARQVLRGFLVAALCLLSTTCLLTGCHTPAISARMLPPQFQAAAAPGDVTVNLGRLATTGTSESVISPGDKLTLELNTGQDAPQNKPITLRVADDGTISVPLVGEVPVSGLETLQAGQAVEKASVERGIFRQPHVTIDIQEKAVNYVTVMGAVNKPGVYGVARTSSDLLHAIAMAGGMSKEAGTEVEIARQSWQTTGTRLAGQDSPSAPVQQAVVQGNAEEDRVELAAYSQLATGAPNNPALSPRMGSSTVESHTCRIDLAAATVNARAQENFHLNDRDVVMVIPAKKRSVRVAGLVNRPGEITLPQTEDLHVLDAIAMAGGSSSLVADKIYVIRRVESQPAPIVIKVSMSRAKKDGRENVRLAPGDMVSIEQTPATAVVDAFTRIIRLSVGVSGATTIF